MAAGLGAGGSPARTRPRGAHGLGCRPRHARGFSTCGVPAGLLVDPPFSPWPLEKDRPSCVGSSSSDTRTWRIRISKIASAWTGALSSSAATAVATSAARRVAPPVFAALAPAFTEDELWISSHQGGHRFAGNVLVLPAGIHLGRIDPDDAPAVVQRALGARIELGHYWGRTFYDAPVQAAEHAIREARGLDGLYDLRLAAVEDSLVRFQDRDGTTHEATVEEVPACSFQPVAWRPSRRRSSGRASCRRVMAAAGTCGR